MFKTWLHAHIEYAKEEIFMSEEQVLQELEIIYLFKWRLF